MTTATVVITGQTYPVRAELRALGGRWVAEAKGWEIPAEREAEARALVAGAASVVNKQRAAKAKATRAANAAQRKSDEEYKARQIAELARAKAAYKLGDDGVDPSKRPAHLYHPSEIASWERCVSMLKEGTEFNVCTNYMFDRGTIWRVRVNEKRQAIIIGKGSWWAMSVTYPDSATYAGDDKGAALGVAIIMGNSGCSGYHMAVDLGYGYNAKLEEGQG
jgi:hypothetical protein